MMNYIFKIVLCCTVLSLLYFNCKKSTEPVIEKENSFLEYTVLAIELESHFDNDSVKIELNNEIILQKRITTNYTISLAWSTILIDYPTGNHTIKVTMPDENLSNIHNFKLSDTLSVRIYYDTDNNQIEFLNTPGLILRD